MPPTQKEGSCGRRRGGFGECSCVGIVAGPDGLLVVIVFVVVIHVVGGALGGCKAPGVPRNIVWVVVAVVVVLVVGAAAHHVTVAPYCVAVSHTTRLVLRVLDLGVVQVGQGSWHCWGSFRLGQVQDYSQQRFKASEWVVVVGGWEQVGVVVGGLGRLAG